MVVENEDVTAAFPDLDRPEPSLFWPSSSTLEPSRVPQHGSHPRAKVLHVITRFIDGAGGNTLLTVLGADTTRFEVWVAGAPGGPLWERAERHGVKTVQVAAMREVVAPRDDLKALVALVRLMRRERFDIVHTHSTKAGFVGRIAAWLSRTPVVIHTIHGFAAHDFMRRRRRWFYLLLERLVRPLTDWQLAVAPTIARQAIELRLASSRAISVVPSAVELDRIPTEPDRQVRQELGVPDDAPLVGTVGRLEYQKAPLDFVRMAAGVARSHPDTRFVMAGEGDLLSETRAEAARLGVDIVFTGYRPDAARIASCFDVYVASSLYEGLGRALTEALASGRPVVATAVGGVADLVEPGTTGLLAPPAAPEELARNVIRLLEHPEDARRMGAAGRGRVRALFGPALMCALIEQTYHALLERARAAT